MIDRIKPFTAEALDRFVDELSPEEDYNFEGLHAGFSDLAERIRMKLKTKKVKTKKILKKKKPTDASLDKWIDEICEETL